MVKIRKNDEVIVIAGKNKGQVGRVLDIDRKNNKIRVDKVNMVKKHVKPSQENPEGQIQEMEAPIHISNVAFHTKGKDSSGTKIQFKVDDKGNKKRVAKSTGKEV